jgi:hypothetical protein
MLALRAEKNAMFNIENNLSTNLFAKIVEFCFNVTT